MVPIDSPTSLRLFPHLVAAGLFVCGSMAQAKDIKVPGGTIDLEFSGQPTPELESIAEPWVRTSAHAIAGYFGNFPVRRVTIELAVRDGHEAQDGVTSGWNGALITVALGRKATAKDLADDWVLPHEMIHLSIPDLDEKHHWLEEGLATYIEPIVRCRAGLIPAERVWGDLVRDLPQGQPEKGDQGLDHTATWGRTYWGGALFCLRADIEIHRRTNNRRGLEDAMRGILGSGGSIEKSWKIDRLIATGDAATSGHVLRELYEEMKDKPVTVDLKALWKELGVVGKGSKITFDDTAPLASVRKAIAGR